MSSQLVLENYDETVGLHWRDVKQMALRVMPILVMDFLHSSRTCNNIGNGFFPGSRVCEEFLYVDILVVDFIL